MALMGNVESLAYFVPELVLIVTLILALLATIFGVDRAKWDVIGALALIGTIIAFLCHISLYDKPAVVIFQGMLVHDMFALFFRGFFIFCTAIIVFMTMFSSEIFSLKKGEFYAILLSVTIGMCLVASSHDMVMIYLALELMSLGSYILAGFARKIGKSEEASLKYVLYGGVSTGMMLFGLSLLYGLTGSTGFDGIRESLANATGGIDLAVYVIFILILAGAGYKIAMVPFHFWAPDVYEGAPTPVTAYLSVASKGAGFALLIRLGFSILLQPGESGAWVEVGSINIDWMFTIALLSAITMTIGNLGAIVQVNLKRLLAYSGIAHAGYILMGVSTLTTVGIESVIFYLIIYLFTNLVAFLVVIMMVEAQDDDRITAVRGLWKSAPYSAVFMTIALLSLIGIPPAAGFVGKVYIFYAILQSQMYWLAVIGALNTVISLYYYARIIKAMFFEDAPDVGSFTLKPVYLGLLIVLTIPIIYFGLFWNPLANYAKFCAQLIM